MFPLQLDSSQIDSLLLVAFAMVLGALIGLDREVKEKPARLRTHMLVAGAAALLVNLGNVVIQHIAVALSQFLLAIGVTGIALITLTGIQTIERQIDGE